MAHVGQIMLVMIFVGGVTTYLKITIDRIFLVLLLSFWMGYGIQQAIVINALVMLLASLLFFRAARPQLAQLPRTVMWSVGRSSLSGAWSGDGSDSRRRRTVCCSCSGFMRSWSGCVSC